MTKKIHEAWREARVTKRLIFEVSSLGRMRKRHRRTLELLPLRVFTDSDGYPCILSRKPVHQFVATAFLGRKPIGLTVNHKDGNKKNNSYKNLEYVTVAENNRHAIRLGLRKCKGQDHGRAKLTNRDVLEIRHLAEMGMTYVELSREFNVSDVNIGMIVAKKTWTHI